MPCSAAIFRTSGDDLVRSRSSIDSPLPAEDLPGVCGGMAVSRWRDARRRAGFAVDSLFGGGPSTRSSSRHRRCCRRRRWRWGGGRRRRSYRACLRLDTGNDRLDRNRLSFRHQHLGQHAGGRRRNLRVYLVCRDLEDRLVALHRVANLLQPTGHRPFGDRLPHLGHHYIDTCQRINLAIEFLA
jgi:hypothetical protein